MLWNCVVWKIFGCSQQPHDGWLPSSTPLTDDFNGNVFLPPSKDASFLFVTGIFSRHDVLTSLSILNHFHNSFMTANPLWYSTALLYIFISTFFIKSSRQFCAVTISNVYLIELLLSEVIPFCDEENDFHILWQWKCVKWSRSPVILRQLYIFCINYYHFQFCADNTFSCSYLCLLVWGAHVNDSLNL